MCWHSRIEKCATRNLLLSLSVRILSDRDQFKINNNLAEAMLVQFVQDTKKHFASYLLTFNFHSLLHLAKEALIQNEPLDDFGVWEFESSNSTLKNYLKQKGLNLQQAHNRALEKYRNVKKQPNSSPKCKVLKMIEQSPTEEHANIKHQNDIDQTSYRNVIKTSKRSDLCS